MQSDQLCQSHALALPPSPAPPRSLPPPPDPQTAMDTPSTRLQLCAPHPRIPHMAALLAPCERNSAQEGGARGAWYEEHEKGQEAEPGAEATRGPAVEGRGRLRPQPDGMTHGRVHTNILGTLLGHLGQKLGCTGMGGCTYEH